MTRSRTSRVAIGISIVVAVGLAVGIPAWAFWSVGSNNVTGVSKADSLVAPAGATATAQSSSAIQISYTPATQPATVNYRVIRSSGPGSPTTVCTVASTTTSCTDSGLTALTTYGYTVGAVLPNTNWTGPTVSASATTQAPAGRTFTITSSANSTTAGSPVTLTIQAQLAGVNDATYTGNKSLTFSGPSNSPDGTAPLYGGTTSTTKNVSFDATGKGTIAVTLFNAVASPGTLITVTDGTTTANAPRITVNAGAPAELCWIGATSCSGSSASVSPSTSRQFTVGITDVYGNTAKATTAITVLVLQRSPTNGTVNPQGTQTIAVNGSQVANATTLTADASTNKRTVAEVTADNLTTATVTLQT